MKAKPSQTNIDQEASREEKLLDQIYQGEQSAFWELWDNYKEYLYTYCLKQMGHNSVDAQEALSISLLRAWDKLPANVSKITNVKGWLTKLIQNVCIDLHRQKKRNFSTIENFQLIAIADSNYLSQIIDTPEIFLLREELIMVINKGIQSLPSNLRIPFVLRFMEEKSYGEIAQYLNISPPNVRKRIEKARVSLKKKLNPYVSGGNYLDSFSKSERDLSSFTYLQGDYFLPAPQTIEPKLEAIFYRLYSTHLETLPSPLVKEELTYV